MAIKIEIEGDSEEAVAFALLQMIARAEGRLDALGDLRAPDRAWLLDTYAECLLAVVGARAIGPEDEEEDDEEEDEEEEEEEEEEQDEDDAAEQGTDADEDDDRPRGPTRG
jgi:uncharacterized membrane protein YukC